MSTCATNVQQWRSQEFDLGVHVYVLTSHCNFKTCVNVPHANKKVTVFFFGGGEGIAYVLTSHCTFKTCVNVPHANKTVTGFF